MLSYCWAIFVFVNGVQGAFEDTLSNTIGEQSNAESRTSQTECWRSSIRKRAAQAIFESPTNGGKKWTRFPLPLSLFLRETPNVDLVAFSLRFFHLVPRFSLLVFFRFPIMSSVRRSIRHPHVYNGATPTSSTTLSSAASPGTPDTTNTGSPATFVTTPSTPSPSSHRQSKSHITVEYHRASRDSIQEYTDLLTDANFQAAAVAADNWTHSQNNNNMYYDDDLVPTRSAPQPPSGQHLSYQRSRTPTSMSQHHYSTHTKSRPRSKSLDPFAAPSPAVLKAATAGAPTSNPIPPRPSRANTATLIDMYNPVPESDTSTLLDHLTIDTSIATPSAGPSTSISTTHTMSTGISVPQSATSSTFRNRTNNPSVSGKNKRGFLNMLPEFLNPSSSNGSSLRINKPEISTPYDPVHLTHVGFNSSTGEFTGLPKEWQQLLQESGISRSEQEKNPQAVMEIVKFYQEDVVGGGNNDVVFEKMGHTHAPSVPGGGSTPHSTRSPPPAPSTPSSAQPSKYIASAAPTPYRPPPAPPSAGLDRSLSTRDRERGSPRSSPLSVTAPGGVQPQQSQVQHQQPLVRSQSQSQAHGYQAGTSNAISSASSYAAQREREQRDQRERKYSSVQAPPKEKLVVPITFHNSSVTSTTTSTQASITTPSTATTTAGPAPPPKPSPASTTSELGRTGGNLQSVTTNHINTAAVSAPQLTPLHPVTPVKVQPPRYLPQPPPSQGVAGALPAGGANTAPTPRRREKKSTNGASDNTDIVKRLQAICSEGDPTKLYRNLVKIGQG